MYSNFKDKYAIRMTLFSFQKLLNMHFCQTMLENKRQGHVINDILSVSAYSNF